MCSTTESSQEDNYNSEHYEILKPHVAERNKLSTEEDKEEFEQEQISSPQFRRSGRIRCPPAYLQITFYLKVSNQHTSIL